MPAAKKKTRDPLLPLWKALAAFPGDTDIRRAIASRFVDLVRATAAKVSAGKPIDRDDLIAPGTEGLLWAVDRFDPKRGFQFATFAAPRIRGAMLDHIRDVDRVPRLQRVREKAANSAREELQQQLGRRVTDDELDDLGVDVPAIPRVHSFEDTGIRHELDLPRLEDDLADRRVLASRSKLHRDLLFQSFTKGLTTEERTIVYLYFYKHQAMKTIGGVMDLSESRVSQMFTTIKARLATSLDRAESFSLLRVS